VGVANAVVAGGSSARVLDLTGAEIKDIPAEAVELPIGQSVFSVAWSPDSQLLTVSTTVSRLCMLPGVVKLKLCIPSDIPSGILRHIPSDIPSIIPSSVPSATKHGQRVCERAHGSCTTPPAPISVLAAMPRHFPTFSFF